MYIKKKLFVINEKILTSKIKYICINPKEMCY